ncbi:MAG: T9SS type A sorting domain-containing protein, partial [Flavobacteriales bacterium]
YNGGSGPNAFIQKYDAFGNLLWEKIETSAGAGGEDYHMSMCTGIDVDPHGNLYVTGTHSHGDAGDVDLFEEYEVHPNVPWSTHYWSWLAKISPTGEILWVRLIERDYTGVHAGVIASDVFYVNDGRILVSALEARTSGEPHSILAFDSAGTIVNSAPFGGWGIGNGCSVISRRPYSVVANYENMQIVYGPKFEGLTNGSVRLKGDFISCEGEIFGSNVLEGHGFVHADLAADLTWSDARFKIEGELIGSSAFDVNGFELPIVVEDQEGNEYMAFDFWGNFSIGGSSFETTREGTALAKLNEDGDLVWLFADTLNYAEYSNPFNYSQQVTSIDIVNNNQGILLKGNYLRMAKFSGMNGSFAQYNNEEKNAYRGRFLNYYDLDGNLIWSKNLKNDHIDFSFWSSSTHGCGDVEFYDQFSTLVDSATNEWQAQVVFTKMSFDCSGSSPCDTRTINMLSADQMVCSQDTITLQTSIVGSLDSLRWHVYQSGHFVPLFGGGTYEHETTDSLVLFDVPNQFVQEVFRLTGYYDNGNETHSNVVQILSEPEFEYENHFINLTCPSVRLYHSDTVDILIDGVYVATLPNTYTQVDTLLHPHLIQLRYLGGCDYVYSDSIQFIPNGVEITEQPQDVFVNQSSTDATFVVEGPNIDQYQWQQSSDNINWNDLQNTLFGPVQGVNTNSLQLVGNSTLIQKAGFYFRVNVENGNCQSVSESGQLVMSTGLTENSLLQFTVLPNPNVGRFEVRVENLAPLLLELFDSIGKKIYSERIEESHRISVNLESGVYLAKVTNSDGNSATKRVVVRSN